MDGFNRVGDYSEEGCPYYEKAVGYGEAALALLQNSTVTIEGDVRSYPTQPIKESIQPQLKRIREKVDAWCKRTSWPDAQRPAVFETRDAADEESRAESS